MGVDGLLSVAHNVLSTENEYFNIFIDGVEDQVFNLQSEHQNDVVQSISSLMSKAATRSLGVRLLNKHLEQCGTEVFTRTGNLWTSLVLKSCHGQEDCCASYEALGQLASKFLQNPELTKTFATTHLTKVYECLVAASDGSVVSALQCIEKCLRLYPSSSGPSKRSLDKFLSRFHDSMDPSVVLYTGKCLHLLQQVSGGEAQSSNHKTMWKNYQIQLVGSIHVILDDMFANSAEMWDDNRVKETLPCLDKLDLSPEPIQKAAQLYIRCHNLLNYLVTALREPFPVEKPFLPRMILSLITRGLGVNCNTLHQNPISDNIALALLLPKFHMDLLHLLDAGISVLKGHLLPYYNNILGLLMDVLKSTAIDEHYTSNQKPFRQLRAKVYDTLALWCRIQSAGSRSESIAEYLFQEILNDITPIHNELTLQVTKAVTKHTSKKMKRQMQKAQNDRSKIAQSSIKTGRTLKASYNDERNQLLCSAALRCLQAVLTSSANFIKPTKIKIIQSSLIQICGYFYELPMDAGALYGSSQCRLEIFNALYVLMTTPHHLSPPPADILLSILNLASNRDGNLKVQNHCKWILQNLEKLLHPQKESLVFPIDAREVRNAFIMLGQERLLANDDNGINDEESEEDLEENTNKDKIEHIEENEEQMENELENNDDVISVDNSEKEEYQENTPNEEGHQHSESPQLVSDTEDSPIPAPTSVELFSGDDSMPLKLQVDEESENDDVEIVDIEPITKKPRIEEVIEIASQTIGEEKEEIIDLDNENANEKDKVKDMDENSTKQTVEEALNTSTDNIIMDIDEDALVEDIASQFVDDLA